MGYLCKILNGVGIKFSKLSWKILIDMRELKIIWKITFILDTLKENFVHIQLGYPIIHHSWKLIRISILSF